MKNQDIQDTIKMFARHGRVINDYEAATYFSVTEILARDPEHAAAKESLAEFRTFLATGVMGRSLARFQIPAAALDTDEDRARRAAWAAEYPQPVMRQTFPAASGCAVDD